MRWGLERSPFLAPLLLLFLLLPLLLLLLFLLLPLLLLLLLLRLPRCLALPLLLLLFLLLLLEGAKTGGLGSPSRDEGGDASSSIGRASPDASLPPDVSLMVMGSASTPDRGGSGAPSCP